MDAAHFDALTRALGAPASRRGAVRGSIAALVASAFALADREQGGASKKCKKPCGKCKRCTHGHCKPEPDGTACGAGNICVSGACALCTPIGGACDLLNAATCCSERCCNSGVGGCGATPCCC
jgi:hypothetical protein